MNKLVVLLFAMTLLYACSKEEAIDPVAEQELITSVQVLHTAAAKLGHIIEAGLHSPEEALAEVRQYLLDSVPDVTDAWVFDSVYLDIETTGAFRTQIALDEKNSEGLSVYRGGASGAAETFTNLVQNACPSRIPNNKVLLFVAAMDDFYSGNEYQTNIVDYLTNSDQSLDVTLLTNQQCTPDALANLNEYGLVIFDTHGYIDAFQTGLNIPFVQTDVIMHDTEAFKNEIIARFGMVNYQRLINSELRYTLKYERSREISPGISINEGKVHFLITTKGIRNIVPDLDNTVVFGNMCYSGWNADRDRYGFPIGNGFTGAMRSTILGKNPIAYYAFAAGGQTEYSYVVPNNFARVVQLLLLDRLVFQTDCTEDASQYEDGSTPFVPFNPAVLKTEINVGALLFNHYGDGGYGYSDCGTYTDSRDGEVYRLACIGDQVWFAENLRYEVEGSLEVPSPSGYDYGRLYDIFMVSDDNPNTHWSESSGPIQGICPPGWHIPSREDYARLFQAIGYDYQPENPPVHCPNGVDWPDLRLVYKNHFGAIQIMGSNWQHIPSSVYTNPDLNKYGLDLQPSGYEVGLGSPSSVGTLGSFWSSSRIYVPFSYNNTVCVHTIYDFEDDDGYTSVTLEVRNGDYRISFGLNDGGMRACRCVKN